MQHIHMNKQQNSEKITNLVFVNKANIINKANTVIEIL